MHQKLGFNLIIPRPAANYTEEQLSIHTLESRNCGTDKPQSRHNDENSQPCRKDVVKEKTQRNAIVVGMSATAQSPSESENHNTREVGHSPEWRHQHKSVLVLLRPDALESQNVAGSSPGLVDIYMESNTKGIWKAMWAQNTVNSPEHTHSSRVKWREVNPAASKSQVQMKKARVTVWWGKGGKQLHRNVLLIRKSKFTSAHWLTLKRGTIISIPQKIW